MMEKAVNSDWSHKKLNELGFVGRGKSRHRPRNEPSLYGGPYPFIQTSDIMASEFYITNYSQTYSEKGLAQSKFWNENTLCMTIAGENTAETAILKFKACFPDSVIGFIADKNKSDVRFVKYLLDTMKSQFKSVSKGATQDNLSLYKLLSFEILIPPLMVQERIADILSAYDYLIENNMRRIQILEEMAQTLYCEWFVKFRFPGHEKVKMVESELGMVPEGWKVVTFKEVVKYVKDNVKAGPHFHQTPYLPIDCLPRKSLAILETKPSIEAKSSLIAFKKEDIIFGAMRPYFHKVIIAPFDGITRSTCFVLRPVNNFTYSWAVLKTFEESTVDYANKHSKGATIPYAAWDGSFADMLCIRPSDEIMAKFDQVVKPMLKSINTSYFRQLNLRRTRDLLLPKLISGEVDVSSLDIPTGELT